MWIFEDAGRNGGNGADSSVEKLGLEDIAGNGVGGVFGLEERIMSRDCGTEECRVVVVEDCRTGGGLDLDVKSHIHLFLDTVVDVRRMFESSVLSPLSSHIVETGAPQLTIV